MRRRPADDRCDRHSCSSLRERWKRGTGRNALGRSRGGFSTKINARTNADGLPIGIEITPGQIHDVTAYPALMNDIDCDPEQMLGDKGYAKNSRRVATRYDKLIESFAAFVLLACIRIWIRFVHTT